MFISVDSSARRESATTQEPYPPALVDRLLTVIGGINAELDHDIVLGRICRACIELVQADAAGFLSLESPQVRVMAGVGFHGNLGELTIALNEDERLALAANPH